MAPHKGTGGDRMTPGLSVPRPRTNDRPIAGSPHSPPPRGPSDDNAGADGGPDPRGYEADRGQGALQRDSAMGRQCPDVRFCRLRPSAAIDFRAHRFVIAAARNEDRRSCRRGQKGVGAGLKLGQRGRPMPPAKHRNRVPIIQDRGRISEALTINVYSWSRA
jgi:hypothetical protein